MSVNVTNGPLFELLGCACCRAAGILWQGLNGIYEKSGLVQIKSLSFTLLSILFLNKPHVGSLPYLVLILSQGTQWQRETRLD